MTTFFHLLSCAKYKICGNRRYVPVSFPTIPSYSFITDHASHSERNEKHVQRELNSASVGICPCGHGPYWNSSSVSHQPPLQIRSLASSTVTDYHVRWRYTLSVSAIARPLSRCGEFDHCMSNGTEVLMTDIYPSTGTCATRNLCGSAAPICHNLNFSTPLVAITTQ